MNDKARPRLVVEIEPEAHRALKIEAARRGTSVAELVRAAVDMHVIDDTSRTAELVRTNVPDILL